MGENEIIDMLGDIRYTMFDILENNEEQLAKVLEAIDEKMTMYRGLTDDEIADRLKKKPICFEVGKCYKHATGRKMRIIGEMDTYYYGHSLIGETDKGEYIPVGREADNAINWVECEDFAKEDR